MFIEVELLSIQRTSCPVGVSLPIAISGEPEPPPVAFNLP